MEAKISNSIHYSDIRRTSESFSNLPQNLKIICKNNETTWANKFVLSFHSPYICNLINQTNLMADVLLLPDFSSFAVNLLFNVINAGFSKYGINVNGVDGIEEVFECAKTLQINVDQSNSSIDLIETHNATDVIEVHSDIDSANSCVDFQVNTDDSEEFTSSNNICIKEEFKDGKNIKKELQEKVDIKKELNIKQESIKQELKDYWGIQGYDDSNEVNDSNTIDMELCSEYVEFGDTSTELEQLEQTPQSSTEFERRPQILYHTNQIQLPEQPTPILSATSEQDPENVNEPEFVTSESGHISDQELLQILSEPACVASESAKLLLKNNLMSENISNEQDGQTALSAANQQQTESEQVSEQEPLINSSMEQNSTDKPSYLENLLEELSTEIEQDNEKETLNDNSEIEKVNEEETLNDNSEIEKEKEIEKDNEEASLNHDSASTSQVFSTFLEQIKQLETSLKEISQTDDPKQQIRQQSEDVKGIDSALTNIKSKLMEINVNEIKKENIYPQLVQIPVNVINTIKTEPTQELQQCEQSSMLDVPPNVKDGVIDDDQDKCDIQNERRNKRKRNDNTGDLLNSEHLNNELKRDYKHQRRGEIKDFHKSIPTKSKINNFKPTFSGKLKKFIIQKEVDLDGYELEGSKNNLENYTFKDILTEIKEKTSQNVIDKKVKVKVFRCQLCSFEDDTFLMLQRHYMIKHFRGDLLKYCNRIERKCLICAEAFNKTFFIVQHLVMKHDQLNIILKENGLEPIVEIQQAENISVNVESGEECIKLAPKDDALKSGTQNTELSPLLTVQKLKPKKQELSNKRKPKLLGNQNKPNAEITIDVDELFKENSSEEIVSPKNINEFSTHQTSLLKDILKPTKENGKPKNDELVMEGMADMAQEKNKVKKKKSKPNLTVLNTNLSMVENTDHAKENKGRIRQNDYHRQQSKLVESFNIVPNKNSKNILDVDSKVDSPTMNDLLQKLNYKKDKSEKMEDSDGKYSLTQKAKKDEEVAKEYKVKSIVNKIKFIANKAARKCEVCSKNYSTSTELEEHICENTGADNSQEMSEDKGHNIKETNSNFQCSICSKHFKNAMFLSVHSNLCA